MHRTSENRKSKNDVINFSLYIRNNFFERSIGLACGNCLLIQSNQKVISTPLSLQDESNDIQLDTVSTSLTLTWGQICIDFSSHLKMTFLGQCKHNSECFCKRNTRGKQCIFPVAMFVRKLLAGISKPTIKSLAFADLWSLNRWP